MNAKPPFPARPGPRRSGAFTLIELMVVLGIIGLTMTLGVPAFVRALHKEGMRKAQSDLLEACQKARAGAILNARPQDLIIRTLEGTIEAPGAFPLTTLPQEARIEAITVNDQVKGESEDDVVVVRFFPKGTSDDFTIVIRSYKDGSQFTLWLDPVTALADFITTQ
jgi:prepilin-type N-terminal cleavage/methylation domain-containing protein